MHISKRYFWFICSTGLGVLLAVVLFAGISWFPYHTATLESVAERIVATCAEAAYRPACYDEEIPKVMNEGYTMEEAFAITRIVQDIDSSYQYCHVLGHELSAQETAKDPERWKDVVARAPLGVCSNGAIHGAFQERFRVESMEGRPVTEIEEELQGVCEPRDGWQPTDMGEATCLHALGHLSMYVTGAAIHDSLALCDRLIPASGNDSGRQLCYDGAFMQIYQPLEPEDLALIEGMEVETQEEAMSFCSEFTGAKHASCLTEAWPLYEEQFDDPATIVGFCDRLQYDEWQHERCISGLFFLAMAGANLSVDWATTFCPNVRSPYEGACFANAAARLIETDDRNVEKALTLCRNAEHTGHHEACYDKLVQFSVYTFFLGSDEFYEICNGLPRSWKTKCLDQVPKEVGMVR